MEQQTNYKSRKERKKQTIDVPSMVYGKVPPQARDIEKTILGAIMLDASSFEVVSEILKPECFYAEPNQRIFRAMQTLSRQRSPIDMVTVMNELRRSEELDLIGGPYVLAKLTDSVTSTANIEAHCKIVYGLFIKREMIRIGGEAVGLGYEDGTDEFELMDHLEKEITNISTGHLKKKYSTLDQEMVKRILRMHELRKTQDHITGIPSGFKDLDSITHGWQPTDLIILAARPSVGKTAFALNIARNAAMHPAKKVPVGFFSLEMSTGQLTDRLLSAETGVFLENITSGMLTESQMNVIQSNGYDPLSKANILTDDTAAIDVFELRSKVRNMKRKHNIGMVIIDYLQLMSGLSEGRNANREQEIAKVSRELKKLGKELEIPIIALSQLSREPEKRKGSAQMPILSDLRESGAIEQDADLVMFMYRPEYYDITASELGESTKGETHIKIAKHRNGRLDTIKLQANLAIQKFSDYDSMYNSNQFVPKGNFRPISTNYNGNDDTPF